MSGLSVLTLVRNREGHLHQLIEGLKRSDRQPDELIVVDMSDDPVPVGDAAFPIRIDRLATDRLPLAAARNRAAALARHDALLFLDVDCIPMSACLARMSQVLAERDGLLCADIRYLGPDDARDRWSEAGLLAHGRPHPVRSFPALGTRLEPDPGLFWSLGFAIRRETFHRVGGFDEAFVGYGAEDTDFGFRAVATGLPLLFVGGAIACHQYHDSHEPPVQHLRDIIANARRFHERWQRWPMEGWLAAFARMGLIAWAEDEITLRRLPTPAELIATQVRWQAEPGTAAPETLRAKTEIAPA